MDKIAVITPVFNNEHFVVECMRSVAFSITDNNFAIEHIVVDDGSGDETWNIIQNNKSPLVRSFRLNKNGGISAARNFGIKQANADFIFCLDSDNVIFQNTLKTLYGYFKQQKTNWIYGDFLRTDRNLHYLSGQDYYGHQFAGSADLLTSIFSGEHFFQQNCFYTKNVFDSVGGYDENMKIHEDLDLFIRFALAGHNPKYLPVPLYLHRFHKNNISKLLGRENNFPAHKADLQILYENYRTALDPILTSRQRKKVQNFLNAARAAPER